MTEPVILHLPEPRHHHHVPEPEGGWPSGWPIATSLFPPLGTVAVCECGTVVVYEGSSGGMVAWWPESRRERSRRLKRVRRSLKE